MTLITVECDCKQCQSYETCERRLQVIKGNGKPRKQSCLLNPKIFFRPYFGSRGRIKKITFCR